MAKNEVIRDRPGICIEMLLTDRPFEDRIRTASALGFSKVEMWFVDSSYTGTPEALGEILADAGVQMTNTVIGSPDGTIGGGLTDPGNLDVIGHVHIAEVPGRYEQGNGEIDYRFLLRRLVELGYDGAFGLEYLPSMDHGKSLLDTVDQLTGRHAPVRPDQPDQADHEQAGCETTAGG